MKIIFDTNIYIAATVQQGLCLEIFLAIIRSRREHRFRRNVFREEIVKFYIGTSGWQYGDWREFYPKTLESWAFLPFYVHNFNSVEINVSFYRMVKKETYQGWARGASAATAASYNKSIGPKGAASGKVRDFVFAVKLLNHFTRIKRLVLDSVDEKRLGEFLEKSSGLGKTLGPLLVQLPQGVHCNLNVLENFLSVVKQLSSSINPKLRIAMEFRHKSWLNNQVYALLQRYECGFVISDSARWPTSIIKTADFVYVRLHGNPKMFYSLYANEELQQWLAKIQDLNAKEVYWYFNNTMKGHAAENALQLKKMV